ncbi:MAG: hypothetical protein K2K45_07580 [Muribaculaceae bacterium]|nr:hypothetical protein [Muribaculaceae bacterium]
MKNIIKRYIIRRIIRATIPFGIDTTKQFVDFVINKPFREWRQRLWVVENTIGYLSEKKMQEILTLLR